MLDIKSKGTGFNPHAGYGDFLRVCDRCIRTLINHSQDLGVTDPSFTRLGHIKTPVNHRKSLAYLYSY